MAQSLEKPLKWVGSSKRDLLALPTAVRRAFGHALDFAQRGEQHAHAKVMKGFGGAGVVEIVEDDRDGPYRAVYTVKFKEAVFALHVFQKKAWRVLPRRNLMSTSFANDLKLPKPAPRRCVMKKRATEKFDVEDSSGNVFADLGLPNAEELKIKSGLVIEISKAIRKLDLTQTEAGERMGLPQAKVSLMLRGQWSNISERKLMDCLNRLGYDIEIKLKPTKRALGQLRLAA